MKKQKLTQDDIINWWLGRFFNTNLKQILEENPEWKENPDEHTRDFYEKYAVTKEQHDAFEKYFYKEVPKVLKVTQKYWRRYGCWTYLDTAPSIKKEDIDKVFNKK